jgi:predicted dehydrogenase
MKTYVLTGAGSRGLSMYAEPITHQFQQTARLAGIYDPNPLRAHYVSQRCGDVPVFDDFDHMLAQTRPDTVIVTTVDCFHHEYILRALQAGCDVITEKPMTIDAQKCRAILAAEQRSRKKVTVTFNFRFMPFTTRIKSLLESGVIGRILNVDFEWMLDTSHGADYFRRWHSRMAKSGGLLVHKATHHFDIINWWINDQPKTVYAFGDLKFYGPRRAARGVNCRTCRYQKTCEFYWDAAADPEIKALYLDTEQADGYLRDGCVFQDEIDIYDTMSVNVAYKNKIYMSYSLVAYSPYEGWRVAINGTEGRLEAEEFQSGPAAASPTLQCRVFDRHGGKTTLDVPKTTGMHGGGDDLLLQRLFSGRSIPDPLGHMADSNAGAMSILIGAAANQSIKTGLAVHIDDLLLETGSLTRYMIK